MPSRNTNRFLPLALGVGAVLVGRAILKKARRYDLRNKVVLITGGSRGLGLVLARQLAAEGAKLAICARSIDQLRRAEQELRGRGAEVLAVPCDLTVPEEVEALVERVRARYGRVDVLINNAAIIEVSPLENLTLADFEEAMNTNFYGPLYAMLAVLPAMQRRHEGRIVNISSVGGKVSLPHLLPYSASKYALAGFSKGLRSEVAKDGVVVTTIFPNLTRTGSPRNVVVKGQHEKEYAWFKIADSLPFLSDTAENTAAEIIQALKNGEAERVITVPGKLAALANELFPELTTDVLGLVARFLPAPGSSQRKFGYQSESARSRGGLARLSDEAAERNNEG
jgi:short-subunit dehydrogenase